MREARPADRRLSAGQQRAIVATVLATLVLDPWCDQTSHYDIHLEPFVAPFGLAATRALWQGRPAASLPWVVALLLCGTNGALALAGIGLGALLTPGGPASPAVPFVAFGSAALVAALARQHGLGRLLAPALGVLAPGLNAAVFATLANVTVAGVRAQLPAGGAASRLAAGLAPSTEVVA